MVSKLPPRRISCRLHIGCPTLNLDVDAVGTQIEVDDRDSHAHHRSQVLAIYNLIVSEPLRHFDVAPMGIGYSHCGG
jgi:hypothetical protein